MVKRRDISASDSELFRSSVGAVQGMKQERVMLRQRKSPSRDAHPATVRSRILDTLPERSDFRIEPVTTADRLYFKHPGVQQRVMEKLRRGQFAIEQELDLHGLTAAMARHALKKFLDDCLQDGRRCVRIIHGKGLGSRDRKPVIKNELNHWLQHRQEILAFCSARPADGGAGAVYVLLKTSQ